MARIQVTQLPLPGTVDSLLAGNPSPPKVLLLSGSDGLRLRAKAGAGISVLRPYYHVGGDDVAGNWIGLGTDGDAAAAMKPTTVDAAKFGGNAEGRFVANGEPRYWIVVQESGAGSVSECELDAVTRQGAP